MPPRPRESDGQAILQVNHLEVQFNAASQVVRAVNDISFAVAPGRVLGIVGESGCGKSATGLSLMRLLPKGVGRVRSGRILFQGADLLALSEEQMRRLRGAAISMVFQDPMSSLNPVMRIGDQVVEAIRAHKDMALDEARDRTEALLGGVGIPQPRDVMARYPHELSGGMRQRVMIAMAVALEPKLIIADEPTTALDPTIQAQVLELLQSLVRKTGTALILITHDFGVISEMADDVIVMYAGCIVERASAEELFANPRHPYTLGLLRSLPRMDDASELLVPIEGAPPALNERIVGCPFAPRCERRIRPCDEIMPPLSTDPGEAEHGVACHNPPATQVPDQHRHQDRDRHGWR